jgi:hypothetical protein
MKIKIRRFWGLFFIFIPFSCVIKMPEIINENISINDITESGFIITWNKRIFDEDIVYECYILDDDKDYYGILGNFVSTVKLNLWADYKNLRKRFDSIKKILRTEYNYFIVTKKKKNTIYYIAVIEWNVTTKNIRRYEIIKTKTKNNDE